MRTRVSNNDDTNRTRLRILARFFIAEKMASLAGVRILIRNTGKFRNPISRTCLRSTVTQLQSNERYFHCKRQSIVTLVPQVNTALL